MQLTRYIALSFFLILQPIALFAATSDHAMPNSTSHVKTLVLGSGCFWGAEKGYEALPGVMDAVSGYADGRNIKPEYREITKRKYQMNPDNYAEVVEVTYNTGMLSTETLLKHFFEEHDPTQKNRQGNDIGTQYRSIILYTDEKQHQTAIKLRDQYQNLLSDDGYGKIVTEIKPLKKFNPAEDYHQDYLKKNPNGYCPNHATGITFEHTTKAPVDNSALLKGRQIVVLEARHCPFCERFKKEVSEQYQGRIPMTFRMASQLDDLKLTTPTWATPTIYFIEDGKEVIGHQGYLNAEAFYKVLNEFQTGQ